MKFTELDSQMRVYETSHDYCVLPEIYIVARLDGRSFTKLTKEKHNFNSPFDEKFRDMMVKTVKHLMNCGFKITYGYTESDEISLLFNKDENFFNRKLRKLNSVLAGEASSKFSLLLGDMACFDCRISQLPTKNKVIDYFRWRNEDASRNALNAHCYWKLRNEGFGPNSATKKLTGLNRAEKNELLFNYGINYNDIPNWQKRGIGIYWQEMEKEGFNPKTGMKELAFRNQLAINYDLPMKDDYSLFINGFLNEEDEKSNPNEIRQA